MNLVGLTDANKEQANQIMETLKVLMSAEQLTLTNYQNQSYNDGKMIQATINVKVDESQSFSITVKTYA